MRRVFNPHLLLRAPRVKKNPPNSRIAAVAALGATLAFAAVHIAGAQSAADTKTVPAAAPADSAAPAASAPAGDAGRARFKNAMCIGCHGIPDYRTAYPVVYSVPMIAGQNQGYIVNALKEYRSGERSHPTMRSIAASLSDQDIADLAAYYSSAKPN
jgi:cytochrome c553